MRRSRRRLAFTLIEMLMVLVVIGILMMMLFKMMGAAGRSSAKGETQALILAIAEALEEFKSEYGQYPACGNSYVTEYVGAFSGSAKDSMTPPADDWFDKNPGDTAHLLYEYGLYWYLMGAYPPGPPNQKLHTDSVQYRRLSKRDEAMLDKWRPHLAEPFKKKLRTDFIIGGSLADVGLNTQYALFRIAIWDAWKTDLKYKCVAPYQTYDLYSLGPDMAEGGPNGIYDRDNIYATARWDAR